MLLVITGSGDATADFIFGRIKEKAFRLNYDLFSDYDFELTPTSWRIKNPAGLQITSDTATACFWWKPFNFFLQNDQYVVEEVKYIFRELYSWFYLRKMIRGNPGNFHQTFGKMNLLSIASRSFRVPESLVVWGTNAREHHMLRAPVAKSLNSGLTNTNKALYTTEVDAAQLDLKYPWFLQEKITAELDITVQYVGRKLFGYARSRVGMKTLDWRQEIFTPQMQETSWEKVDFSDSIKESLIQFADELNIHWGRVDLIGDLANPYFLEFNANGQWLFLDAEATNGLADAVIEYLLSGNENL